MLDHLTFAVSAGLTLLLTNFDNLAVLFGLLRPLGTTRAVASYGLAQIIVLVAALSLATLAGDMLTFRTGFLGFIPIAMGVFSIWRNRHAVQDDVVAHVQRGAAGLIMAIVTFLTMSVDSLTVLVPLFADSAASFRMAAFVGAAAAIVLMAGGHLGRVRLGGSGQWLGQARRIDGPLCDDHRGHLYSFGQRNRCPLTLFRKEGFRWSASL